MKTIITGGKILTPNYELTDHQILIEDGVISSIKPLDDERTDQYETHIDANGLWVTPGLIDIHTHGCMGADAMDATPQALETIGQFMASHGVTSYFPTTISASPTRISEAIDNIVNFHDNKGAKIVGIHIEGPYLNTEVRGAQLDTQLRAAHPSEYEAWFAGDLVKLVTVAPEIEGVLELIKHSSSKNVYFAVGHSVADYETMQEAVDAGLSQATHLFNGMAGLHHRKPGVVGSVLTDDRIFAQIIPDGVHLHPATIQLVIKAKGLDKTILISDSIRATGLPDGDYDLGGQTVTVCNGVANLNTNGKAGSLAGSTLTLDQAVRNMIKFTGLSFQDVIKMATIVPAKSVGLDQFIGSIETGKAADLVFFNDAYEVKFVMVNGKVVNIKE